MVGSALLTAYKNALRTADPAQRAGYLQKLLGYAYPQQFVDMLPAMLFTCLMGACVYPISFLNLSDWIILPLQVMTGVVVYAGLSAIFKVDSFGYILGILNRFLKKE